MRHLFDDRADITDAYTGTTDSDACHHALIGALDHALDFRAHIADKVSTIGVTVKAFELGGDIDVQNITIADDVFGRRNAVADDFVFRGTNTLRKAVIIQRRWNRVALDDVLVAQLIDVFSAHARLELVFNEAQSLRGQQAGLTHKFDFTGRFNANHARNITDLDLIGYPLKRYSQLMSIIVKRTDSSSYFPPGFEALERAALESVPGVRYCGTQDEVPSEGDLCLLTNTHTDLAKWEALRPRVKLILHPNSGHDNLVPGWTEVPLVLGNPIRAQAVAEWCLSALYTHAAPLRHHSVWPKTRDWPRTLTSERRTLIVGHGHVGKILQQKLQATVLDPFEQLDADLWGGWDVVILAASLNKENRHLLDEEFFNTCPPDFLLINPARGELVDEKALREFLTKNPQARAVLDVHELEPFTPDYWNTPQVIATPHIAGVWQGLIPTMIEYETEVLNLFTTGQLS